jgi:hypothetical protein
MANAEFIAELDAFEREIDTEIRRHVEAFIEEALMAICVGNTIVLDTGRSTASWVTSTGSPIFYIAIDVTPTSRLDGVAATVRSLRTLDNLQGYKLGEPVFIANGNEYVLELEFGSKSRKAPSGFVELSLAGLPEVQYSLGF